ncbi:hypothetical protein PENTCL1PPCAC_25080, partial [Pristionchus entomophagus]
LLFVALISATFAAPFTTDSDLLTPEYFAVADKNGDGKIDFDEYLYTSQAYINEMMQQFAKMDKDGSDSLDVKEFTALSEPDKNRFFVDLVKFSTDDEPTIVLRRTEKEDLKVLSTSEEDSDSDDEEMTSVLDNSNEHSDEIAPYAHTISPDDFDEYDDDGNGMLNEDELMTYIQDYLEMALKRSANTIINRYDANKNGGIGREELAKFVAELPEDLVDPLTGDDEYDYVHDEDENDYGFAADSFVVSDHH